MLDNRGSCFCWSDRPARTSNQNGTDLTFKSPDSLCDRRRRQIEPACSFGNRTVIDRHQEGFKEFSFRSTSDNGSSEPVGMSQTQ